MGMRILGFQHEAISKILVAEERETTISASVKANFISSVKKG